MTQVLSCEFAKFLGTPFLTEHLCWLFLKGRSDFQTKGLKRERKRDLKSTAVDRNSITISYFNSRRGHSIDISDNIYGCLSGLCCRCFFKIMNFSDCFRQCFKLFYSFEKYLFMDFLEFPKNTQKK